MARRVLLQLTVLVVVALGPWLAVRPLARGQDPQTATQEAAPKEDGEKKPQGLALSTAETLEFTTDEVTWMSLDVSPDGKTVVFDLLGDLYTMPITGGEARRIVGGLSFESQPTYSPDGKAIAFLSDRSGVENLWIADADGTNPRAVTKDERTNDRPQIMASPAWTPDGEYLVVSKARARPIPARSGCSCTTATAAPAYASALRHRPSRVPTRRPDRHRRRRQTGSAPSSRQTAASSTTRSAPARSPTTRAFLSGRSTATIARLATPCR